MVVNDSLGTKILSMPLIIYDDVGMTLQGSVCVYILKSLKFQCSMRGRMEQSKRN